MSSVNEARPRRQKPVILKPYIRPNSKARLLEWWFVIPFTLLYCLISGFFFAALAPFVITPFLFPIVLISVFAIWALPDSRTAPTRTMQALFASFFIALIMWPPYLAIALPGLPWITMSRLFSIPLLVIFLICLSSSPAFRARLAEGLSGAPAIWKMISGFAVLQILSVALAKELATSFQICLNNEVIWIVVFFVSCYVFMKSGHISRWAYALWIMNLVLVVIGFAEFHKGQLLWADHIPSFLKIQGDYVDQVLAGALRDGVYRVQTTFSTSLSLGEFVALSVPFVLHFAVSNYRPVIRVAAVLTLPLMLKLVLWSGSRLGLAGFGLAPLVYLLFWGALRWRRNKESLLGRAIVLVYPLVLFVAVAASIVEPTLHRKVWGGSGQQASNDSRVEQYHMGIPKILHQPVGYGAGMGGDTLGYVNEAGDGSIDSYYLVIGLEYGVIGFILYYGILIVAIVLSAKYGVKASDRDREFRLLVPITISLINFLIIKSVFAQDGNHPLIFMMLGAMAALIYRIKQDLKQDAEVRSGLPALADQGATQVGRPRWFSRPAQSPARP
jgi:hypothetical protein